MKRYLLLLPFLVLYHSYKTLAQANACTPTYGSACNSGDYIDGFVTTTGITNINNNFSGCNGNTNNYIFYGATHKHTAMQGNTVNFTIYNCPSWSQGYKIWVDWNDNGLFTDAGDLVYNAASTLAGGMSASGSFVIPINTAPGIKRLRVRCVYGNTVFTDCDNQTFGETEDYQLVVLSNNCSGTPTAGILKSKLGSVLCGTKDSLYLENTSMGQGITYTWQMQNGASWTTLGVDTNFRWSPEIYQNRNFRVQVTCTNAGGGSVISNVKTIEKIDPVLDLGPDTTVCLNSILPLAANLVNAASYLWNNNQTSQSINVTTPGTYSVKVTQSNGCIGRDTLIVSSGEEPVNIIPASIFMCADSFVTIDAGNTGHFYLWSNNLKTQTITVASAGAYAVEITSPDSCKLTANTNVSLNPRPTFPLLVDTYTICINDSVLLNAVNPAGYTYTWSSGQNSATIYALDSGLYNIHVVSDKGCPANKNIQLNWYRDPEVKGFTYIPKFFEEFGKVEFAPIGASAVTSYHWNFGDGKHSYNAFPTHKYDSIGTYSVTLTVTNNCNENTYGQVITLKGNDIEQINKLKNIAVYPNPTVGELMVEHTDQIKIESVQIMDVTGKIIYQQTVGASKTMLQLSHLVNGLYLLKVIDAKGEHGIHKFEIVK